MITQHSEEKAQPKLVLDPAKLLGFRNVSTVMGIGSDIRASADLAFTKRGTEASA